MSDTATITIDETMAAVSVRNRTLYSETLTLTSGLNIGGKVVISGTGIVLDVSGQTILRSASIESGSLIIDQLSASNINVASNINTGNLTVRGSASITLDEAVLGNFNLTGNLSVSGSTVLEGSLISGATGVSNLSTSGTLNAGTSILQATQVSTLSALATNLDSLTMGGTIGMNDQRLDKTSQIYGRTDAALDILGGNVDGSDLTNDGGVVQIFTPDGASGWSSIKRLNISVAATAVATWATVTHTGIVITDTDATASAGAIAVSGSDLLFYNGTSWRVVSTS